MAKAKPPPPDEDEAQSRRFLDLAKELQDAGELSPTEDGEAFQQLVTRQRRDSEKTTR